MGMIPAGVIFPVAIVSLVNQSFFGAVRAFLMHFISFECVYNYLCVFDQPIGKYFDFIGQ